MNSSVIVRENIFGQGVRDYFRIFPLLLTAVGKTPLIYVLAAALSIDLFLPDGVLELLLRLAVIPALGMALSAVTMQYFIDLFVERKPAVESKFDAGTIGNYMAVTIQYWVFGGFLLCLLIVPGLLWMGKASLAAVAVLDEKVSPGKGLELSKELTKDRLKVISGYLLPAVLMQYTIIFSGSLTVAIMQAFKIPDSWICGVLFVLALTVQILGLAIIPMLVNLYAVFKKGYYMKGALDSSP